MRRGQRIPARIASLRACNAPGLLGSGPGMPGPYLAIPNCVSIHAYSKDWSFKRS